MACFLIMTGCDHGAAYAEVDQFAPTMDIATREANDLRKMDCGQIRIYEFECEADAQDYTDEKDAKWPKAKLVKKLG